MKTKIKRTTFASCGLDVNFNFLQAPLCDCGCGGYMSVILRTEQELYDFMGSLLADHDCDYCAIFALNNDSRASIAVRAGGKITFHSSGYNTGCRAKRTIAQLQKDYEFHCYGLLEQVDSESYRIIME